MLRLVVIGAEEPALRNSAARLRGATLIAGPEPPSPATCDAVAFVGTDCPRREMIERFLTAGKHVLLTRPMGLVADELATLSEVARRAGVQMAVANPDRYLPSRQMIARTVDAGNLGEVVLVRIHHWDTANSDERGPFGIVTPVDREVKLVGWLGRQVDVVVSLMGVFPSLVYATLQDAMASSTAAGMYLQVHLGFPQGRMALLDYTDRLPQGDRYHAFSLIGSAGAAYADDHQNTQLVFRGGHPQAVRTAEEGETLTALIQEFVDGLRAGRDFTAGVAAWRHVRSVVDAVWRSVQSQRAVVPEGP
jgi:predicted dehydrogenase